MRDALLGHVAQDLDIATSATPDQVIALFSKTVDVGKSFGVVRVLEGGADMEVATFRSDGEYRDGRRPESVRFADEREDALRRDFTVNALFFDPLSDRILDFVGGRKDLADRSLRTVGVPEKRFAEDRLRLVRAVRFAAQLGFTLEPETWSEVRRLAGTVVSVSRERVRDEMLKMFKRSGGAGLSLLRDSGLLAALFPSLAPWGDRMVAEASSVLPAPVADPAEALVRWLAPIVERADGRSAAEEVLFSLRPSRAEERFSKESFDVLENPERFWSLSLGRRLVAYDRPSVRLALVLLDRHQLDPRQGELRRAWEGVLREGVLPAKLLRGDDLKGRLGGPMLGRCLDDAYEAQLEGRFANRDGALTWAEEWIKLKTSGEAP